MRQAYFLGANDPYKSLKTTLKAEIDEDAWESLHGDVSRPFARPQTGRIAVKVINHLGDEVGAGDRAELGADEDAGAPLFAALAFHVAPFGADVTARPAGQGGEGDAVFFVRLLHARRAEVVQDRGREIRLVAVGGFRIGHELAIHAELVVLVHHQDAVGREAFDGERPGHADLLLVLVGLVVEELELGLGGD